MKASTEEFLLFLLWSAESLARPTWNNLETSFEGWAFRNGLGRKLGTLQREQLVESPKQDDARIIRLTEKGRAAALGGRDPVACWQRPWDGRWRMVLFDVSDNARRQKLRRLLRETGFGWLQNSVWIAPDLPAALQKQLTAVRADVESLLVMEGTPAGGETSESIVRGSWDFERINVAYMTYLQKLRPPPEMARRDDDQLESLRQWLSHERALWTAAIERDPLLPRPLWPVGYLGERAWQTRTATLSELGHRLAAL